MGPVIGARFDPQEHAALHEIVDPGGIIVENDQVGMAGVSIPIRSEEAGGEGNARLISDA